MYLLSGDTDGKGLEKPEIKRFSFSCAREFPDSVLCHKRSNLAHHVPEADF
jgi:hypothetical protein